MMLKKNLVRLMGVSLIILCSGCAPAYRAYSDCYVECKYCVPPPLPYVSYDPCVCHSHAAAYYLGTERSSINDDAQPDSAAASRTPISRDSRPA